MVNNLTVRHGFALLELIIVMVIVVILLSVIISNGMNFVNRAKLQATIGEMSSIAQASLEYYNASSSEPNKLSWPTSISSLTPMYLPHNLTSSPLGEVYQLSFEDNSVTVITVIPKGISIDPNEGSFLMVTPLAKGTQISITQSIPNEFSGRLMYDLHYLYKE